MQRRVRRLVLTATMAMVFSLTFHADRLLAQPASTEAAPRLDEALLQLGRQYGRQIIFSPDQVVGKASKVAPSSGDFELSLKSLLADTGLGYRINRNGTVIIVQATSESSKSLPASRARATRAATEEPDDAGRIVELVVTAQKRDESVHDVPIAISALSGQTMEDRGIESPVDLQFSVPNLDLGRQSSTFSISSPTLRGLGSTVSSVAGDPAVTFNVDGFFNVSEFGLMNDFVDVERVEVLRGPQGTLYGRNSLGGSINVITRRPTRNVEGLLSVDLGSYDKRLVQGVLSGPITDRLRARIAVADESREGYIKNVSVLGKNKSLLTSDYTTVRVGVDLDVTEDVTAYLSAGRLDDAGINAVYQLEGPASGPLTPYELRVNDPYDQKEIADSLSLKVDWKLRGMTLRALGGLGRTDTSYHMDTDVSDTVSRPYLSERLYRFSTQELQLVSSSEQYLRWVAGLYFLDLEGKARGLVLTDPSTLLNERSKTQSSAAYAQFNYDVSDQWEAVAGVRYTRDEKQMALRTLSGERTWEPVTYHLGANYRPNGNIMMYVSHSKGFRAGGGTAQGFFDPETLYAYEAGMKARLFERRMTLDVSIFNYDQDDKQVSIAAGQIGSANFVRNAGKARISGAELELQWALTDRISLDSSLSYLDGTVLEYTTFDPKLPALGVQDLSGNTLRFAPKWRTHVGVAYRQPVPGLGEVTARIDHAWVDERESDEFNYTGSQLPPYHRTNARLRAEDERHHWELELYVQNLENKAVRGYYGIRLVNPPSYYTQYLPPRTFGLKLSRKFGGY